MKILLILSLFISSASFGQKPSDLLGDKINVQYLEKLVHKEINKIRIQKKRKVLKWDNKIKDAAFHHANYMKRTNKLTHKEKSKKFKHPHLRMNQYGATYFNSGENVAFTFFNTKLNDRKKGKNYLTTYQLLAEDLVEMWVHSKYHYQNLIDKDFTHTGVGISIDYKTKKVFAVQNFGGN